MPLARGLQAVAFALWALAAGGVCGELILFDFERGFSFATVRAHDVKVAEAKKKQGSALRIASFHHHEWPGITLRAPRGRWDLSKYEYLALDVKNVGNNDVTVCCRVDNPGADGIHNCVTGRLQLQPGQSGMLNVPLKRRPPHAVRHKLFGMRGYPSEAQGSRGVIDVKRVTQLLVFVPRPKQDHLFEIDNIRVAGTYVPPKIDPEKVRSFFPFIDTFGQYIHKDWPGKTHSLDDMARRLEAERIELEARPGPPSWNKYGGWQDGPTLKATGFFRVEKHKGKWWLVDPEGKLFFSHGIDCVRASDATPIDDRKQWFKDFPGDKPQFKNCFRRQGRVVHGDYQGKRPMCFSFTRANVMRKYGENWKQKLGEMAHRRLRSWGLNTIANWSDPGIYLMKPRRTPYCVAIHFGGKPLEGSRGYWGKFRDVFDPSFRAALRERMAKEVVRSAGDPWCIGYFVDNELAWGDEASLAVAALVSPPGQVAKKVFIADLKAKYGAIEKLNEAWGTRHASWDALLHHRGAPNRKKAWADLTAFYTKTAQQYFKTCREAVKEVAPKNLYLGCRFAWVNNRAVAAAAKYCDVVSYNQYRRSVAGFRHPVKADKPVIIGEFHFGALDRGMFHTGLRGVKNQQERANAYRSYVIGALRNPIIVGTGWFKYMDEPTTGRGLDGENYQIGFLDCCDTPYRETIEACREVGYRLYEIRMKAK